MEDHLYQKTIEAIESGRKFGRHANLSMEERSIRKMAAAFVVVNRPEGKRLAFPEADPRTRVVVEKLVVKQSELTSIFDMIHRHELPMNTPDSTDPACDDKENTSSASSSMMESSLPNAIVSVEHEGQKKCWEEIRRKYHTGKVGIPSHSQLSIMFSMLTLTLIYHYYVDTYYYYAHCTDTLDRWKWC